MDRLVDKELSELITQLNKRTDFLKQNKYPLIDFATSQTIYRNTHNPTLKTFTQMGEKGKPGTKGESQGGQKRDQGNGKQTNEKPKNTPRYGAKQGKGEGPNNQGNSDPSTESPKSGGNKGKKNDKKPKTQGFPNPQGPLNNEESGVDGDWQQVNHKRGRPQGGDRPPRSKRQRNNYGNQNRGWDQYQNQENQPWERNYSNQGYYPPQGTPQTWRGRGRGQYRGGRDRGFHNRRAFNQRRGWGEPQDQGIILSKREMDLIWEYRKPME